MGRSWIKDFTFKGPKKVIQAELLPAQLSQVATCGWVVSLKFADENGFQVGLCQLPYITGLIDAGTLLYSIDSTDTGTYTKDHTNFQL